MFLIRSITEVTDAPGDANTPLDLALNTTVQGTISTTGDKDWYAVELVAGQTYSFAMIGTGNSYVRDPYLRLYAENGTTLLASDDDGLVNQNAFVRYTAATSGTYFIEASAFNTGTGQYGLAASIGAQALVDDDMLMANLESRSSWSPSRGQGVTLTYGFRDVGDAGHLNFSHFSLGQMLSTRMILKTVSDATKLVFQEVNPGGYTNAATLLFANYDEDDGSGGHAFYPGSTAHTSAAGDVWINRSAPPASEKTPASWGIILHELGHALGLSHPGDYGAGIGVSISYENDARIVQDSGQYTAMSYFGKDVSGATDTQDDTLALYDIAALQKIYGANTTTRTGDTIYGFSSNAGEPYNFGYNQDPSFVIWDAGGIDTIRATNYAADQIINLTAGSYSDIGGHVANIAIAFGARIEHAWGGRGDDVLNGNIYANNLYGQDGADELHGFDGNDWLYGGGGGDRLFGGAGVDRLFADSTNPIAPPAAFTLIETDFSANTRLRVNAAELFPMGSFTIEFLWKQQDLADQHYSLDIGSISIYRYANGETGLMYWNAADNRWNYGAIPNIMTDGEAHRVSITYNNATGVNTVYVDGVLEWTTTFTPGSRGLQATGDIVFDDDAMIGDLRIFNHARSATEIFRDSNLPLQSPETVSGLVQYWVGSEDGRLVSALSGKPNFTSTGLTPATTLTLTDASVIDTLTGGLGNDIYYVNDTVDVIVELAAEGTDRVYATADFTLPTQVEDLYLMGTAIRGTGNDALNRINGNASNNIIEGGLGSDTLVGGAGSDTFVFNLVTSANRDRITDFAVGVDKLQFDADLFGVAAGTSAAGLFQNSAAPSLAQAQLFYNGTNQTLYFDANGLSGGSIAVAALNGVAALSASDIILA